MTTIDYSKPGIERLTATVFDGDVAMFSVNDGWLVRFSDHAAIVDTLLARCKALEEAMRQSEKFIRDYLRDSGGCDHDVGICECDTKRLLDSVVAALAAKEQA